MAHPYGLFTWADISLPDVQAGREFYEQLFGWTSEDQRDEQGNLVYIEFRKDGDLAAGAGPQQPETAGGPPVWSSYANVDSVDDTIAAVEAAGGSVLLPGMDVFAAGRMAIVADPTGAVFSLWQAGEHLGADRFNEPGFITWNELATRDVEGAKSFYHDALGFDFQSTEMEGMAYTMCMVGERPAAGIMAMDENWPADMPPHWMVYFNVADTDEAAKKVTELGGAVAVAPFDSPAGRMAVINDPQGGTFSIIAPTQAV